MSIYVTPAVVLVTPAEDANLPWIGYHTVVTRDNISADEEAEGYPASNLANPSTAELWKGETDYEQTITVAEGAATSCDYYGIARHNLGSSGATVKLQKSSNGIGWTDVTEALSPTSDAAIMYRFSLQAANFWRLLITPGSAVPQAAVLHLGRLLIGQRRMYVNHTPITLGHSWNSVTGISGNGQYLGQVLRDETLKSSVQMQNLTPGWYRTNFEPFVKNGPYPFFWAWRPTAYPAECGYAWLRQAPAMSNQRANGMVQVSFDMEAIA